MITTEEASRRMQSLQELQRAVRDFAAARSWEQFHSPKNLAIALSVEAAELLEHFQWLPEEQSSKLSEGKLEAVAQEMADVQIYLVLLADVLGVDLLEASTAKLNLNEARYPVDRVRGSARKYTEYRAGSDEPE